jgi:hypothetical protein
VTEARELRHTGSTVFPRNLTGRRLPLPVLAPALAVATVLAAQDLVFRTGVSLVRVDAQVTGKAGGIDGLHKEDFEIRDNGELCSRCQGQSARSIIQAIVDGVSEFSHGSRYDDVTVVAIRAVG